MLPRLIVHALSDLKETDQVLGAQIESVVGTPKIKTAGRAKIALSVLTCVAPVGLQRPVRFDGPYRLAGATVPKQDFFNPPAAKYRLAPRCRSAHRTGR